MKKKYKIVIVMFAIIGLLYLISTTLADYVSSASGMGFLGVAKWHVLIRSGDDVVDISDTTEHDISAEIEMTASEDDGILSGKVAPESKLVGSFTIDPDDTEVDIEYEVTIGEFSCVDNTEYTPNIEITDVTINDNSITLDENNKFSGEIALGNDPAEIKIYAYWSSSEQDYLIGENIEEIQLPINIYVKQSVSKWQTILDLFKNDKLHIGDFVTYDAGTWTEEEIDSIEVGLASSPVKPNKSTALPNAKYQFGGFTAGMSRNVGATPSNSGAYMYAKMYDDGDDSNKVAISGWRIWDIDEENEVITLVTAANSEDYYHINETNGAYIAEYILTGIKHTNWTATLSDYKIRDWTMYENPLYGATNARLLSETELTKWYNKYLNAGITSSLQGNNSVFQKIYTEPNIIYQNLIDNHSYYWIGTAYTAVGMRLVYSTGRSVYDSNNNPFGIRVLVSIPLESFARTEPIAERKVTLEGMIYAGGTYGAETIQTYNVWELRQN